MTAEGLSIPSWSDFNTEDDRVDYLKKRFFQSHLGLILTKFYSIWHYRSRDPVFFQSHLGLILTKERM